MGFEQNTYYDRIKNGELMGIERDFLVKRIWMGLKQQQWWFNEIGMGFKQQYCWFVSVIYKG